MRQLFLVLWIFAAGVFASCSKDDPNTELSGDTDIALTKVDSVSGVYLTYNNTYISSTDMKVVSNVKGDVTYEVKMDLNTLTPELKAKAIELFPKLRDYHGLGTDLKITPDLKLEFRFKLKITSEGYLDYFTDGKPWVMARYGDGVGTKYTIKNKNGETLTRAITEKTGKDEWPLGFYLIKTSLIEQEAPSDHPVFERISYRVNHRFGLVYVEFLLKDGSKVKFNIIAFFV
ncbi:MAG: hypothetical protein IPM26_10950 [Saprospiraceae bacterium]|nr:hypothetical protein [Saprospiraceae bacterium]